MSYLESTNSKSGVSHNSHELHPILEGNSRSYALSLIEDKYYRWRCLQHKCYMFVWRTNVLELITVIETEAETIFVYETEEQLSQSNADKTAARR